MLWVCVCACVWYEDIDVFTVGVVCKGRTGWFVIVVLSFILLLYKISGWWFFSHLHAELRPLQCWLLWSNRPRHLLSSLYLVSQHLPLACLYDIFCSWRRYLVNYQVMKSFCGWMAKPAFPVWRSYIGCITFQLQNQLLNPWGGTACGRRRVAALCTRYVFNEHL